MNLFGWIGVFFIAGGLLFAAAAWSMSRAKRITAVEAKVISLPETDGGEAKDEADQKENDGMESAVEYEFMLRGETVRVESHGPTSRAVGESEKMYYDTISGALYHPRMLGSMLMAAAAFAVAGIAMILFQHVLLP